MTSNLEQYKELYRKAPYDFSFGEIQRIVATVRCVMDLLVCYEEIEDLRIQKCKAENDLIQVWYEEHASRDMQEEKHQAIQKKVFVLDRQLERKLEALRMMKERIG